MKKFSEIAEAVNPATNTPFERAVRRAHPTVVVDVPAEMSGDNVIQDMPKDRSRPADRREEDGLDHEDIHEDVVDLYEGLNVISEDYGPISSLIFEINQRWQSLDPMSLDPVALEVLREDFQAIRDYIFEETEDIDSGSPTDVSFSPPAGKAKKGADTPLAPIEVDPVPTPGKYDEGGLKFKETDVFTEAFIPGTFLLKDGAEVKLNDQEAHILNRFRSVLSKPNSKLLDEKIKKNFHTFKEILEFARTAIDGE